MVVYPGKEGFQTAQAHYASDTHSFGNPVAGTYPRAP